jgi:hypothetical protein
LSAGEVQAEYDSGNADHLNPTLVLDMPFVDGTVPIQDISDYGNHGTPHGVTWTSDGGGSYSFDGVNDYIGVDSSPSLDMSRIAISAWIKPSTVTGVQEIVRRISYAPTASGYLFRLIDNRLNVEFWDGGVMTTSFSSSGVFQADMWHHVTLTYDGSTATIYVDGAYDSQAVGVSSLGSPTGELAIGACPYGGEHFSGGLDEVLVYSRALSAGEVQAEYDSGNARHAN